MRVEGSSLKIARAGSNSSGRSVGRRSNNNSSSNGSDIGTNLIQAGAGAGAIILGTALFKFDMEEGFWGSIGKTVRLLLFPVGAAVGISGLASLVGLAPKETNSEEDVNKTESLIPSTSSTNVPKVKTQKPEPIEALCSRLKKIIDPGIFTRREKAIHEVQEKAQWFPKDKINKNKLIEYIAQFNSLKIIKNLVAEKWYSSSFFLPPNIRVLGLDAVLKKLDNNIPLKNRDMVSECEMFTEIGVLLNDREKLIRKAAINFLIDSQFGSKAVVSVNNTRQSEVRCADRAGNVVCRLDSFLDDALEPGFKKTRVKIDEFFHNVVEALQEVKNNINQQDFNLVGSGWKDLYSFLSNLNQRTENQPTIDKNDRAKLTQIISALETKLGLSTVPTGKPEVSADDVRSDDSDEEMEIPLRPDDGAPVTGEAHALDDDDDISISDDSSSSISLGPCEYSDSDELEIVEEPLLSDDDDLNSKNNT